MISGSANFFFVFFLQRKKIFREVIRRIRFICTENRVGQTLREQVKATMRHVTTCTAWICLKRDVDGFDV